MNSRAAAGALLAGLTLAACGSTVQLNGSGSLTDGSIDAFGNPTVPVVATDAAAEQVVAGDATVGPGTASAVPTADAAASASDAAAATTGSGGTGATTPVATIPIGIVLTSTASVAAAGFTSGETYSEQQVDQGLIDAFNSKGGILGRKLAPVYASTDPNSSNWSSDFAAACASFTQDHHVVAVLGYVFNYDAAFETCLSKKKVPHLATGFNVPDAIELAQHPLHRALAVPTIDHRSLAKLNGSIEDGWLSTKSKLALVVDGCPGTQRSYQRVAKPLLDRQGIKVHTLYEGGCTNGSADAANGAQSVPGAILKMRQQGVDVLSFLTVSEGPALLIVATAAESQGWRPTYIVSSLANLSALESQTPPAQLANVKGYGWMPPQDLAPARQPKKNAGQQRCIDLLASVKIKLSNFGDFTNAYRMCDALFAYEAALLKTAGTIDGTAVINAVDSLGSSFSNPDVLDGASIFGKGRENAAPSRMRAIIWNSSCSCFVYTGKVRPLP